MPKKAQKLMRVQQNLLKPDRELKAILTYLCEQSNSLYNCGVYWGRQIFFKTGKIISKLDPVYELGKSKHARAMPSTPAQQTLLSVSEAFASFRQLRAEFNKGNLESYPRVPKYRKSGGLYKVSFPPSLPPIGGDVRGGGGKVSYNSTTGLIRFPLGRSIKCWFGLKEFYITKPENIDWKLVKEVTILPRNGEFYLDFSMLDTRTVKPALDKNLALGIDPGLNNWLACVDNLGNSFLVDGFHVKSMTRNYNRRVGKLKTGKPEGFWNQDLSQITEKCTPLSPPIGGILGGAVNKAARLVVNHCLKNQIGKIIFGWNKGQKEAINLGRKTNQKFVQTPTAKLKARIKQLCELYGIEYIETEESYTSQASFLDGDSLPLFGEKPPGWKASGKRVKRGLYQSADGSLINADLNGAANILRKANVNMKLGLDLTRMDRRCLTTVARCRLWSLKRSLRLAKESPSL